MEKILKVNGDMYQISNNQTLGITEEEIIANLYNIVKQVIEQERIARKNLAKNEIELKDRVYRAYGILTNAVKLSSEEASILLSDVKLGVDLGILIECNDSQIKKMELYTKPANLQKYLGEMLNGYERDVKRCEIIKKQIS